jgi:import inner membrane translocase subunit TIM50
MPEAPRPKLRDPTSSDILFDRDLFNSIGPSYRHAVPPLIQHILISSQTIMLMTRTFTRALPVRVARPLPQPLPRALPRISATQFIRQKSNRHRPRDSAAGGQFNSNIRPTPRDPQNNPNSRAGRTVGSPFAESLRQDQLSEETAELDSGAQPGRNVVSDSQPGPGIPRGNDGRAQSTSSQQQSQRQDQLSEETAEFDSAARPGRNETSGTSQEPQLHEEPTARKPLPDLRQGIPSTFAEEFLNQKTQADGSGAKTHHDANNITDDPHQSTTGSFGEGPPRDEGELPESAYKTSIDKRRERLATWMYIAFAMFGVTGAVFLGRNWETEEEERAHATDAPSGWGLKLFWDRVKARVSGQMGYYTEPTFPKLLPDMDPAPPYTLVLSLEDLMVHSEWTREHGWRTAKRPGVDYFLGYLSQYYELVLFTSLPVSAADQIVRKLDPYHFMAFPLFREATRYEKGSYVKVNIAIALLYICLLTPYQRICHISTDHYPRSSY